MDVPKVSIIMPSLNVRPYIIECLESVIQQTLKEIEIICVDAGSTDGTLEVLENYAKRDSRIRLIHSEKKSYGYQMNLGIDQANGKYIGIVETDDYVPENMYEDLFDVAEKNNVDLVKADFFRFTHDGKGMLVCDYNHVCNDESYYNRVLKPREELVVFKFIMNTWSGIYNRKFLLEKQIRHNETPGASFQDTGFWFQTLSWAERVLFINKPYYMNRRDNPFSSVYNRNKIYCPCDEYDFIYQKLSDHQDIIRSVLPAYQFMRYKGYMASLNRSAVEYKREFLERFKRDFTISRDKGELDLSLFNGGGKRTLKMIMRDPEEFFVKNYGHELVADGRATNPNLVRKACLLYRRIDEYYSEFGFKRTLEKAIKKLRKKK